MKKIKKTKMCENIKIYNDDNMNKNIQIWKYTKYTCRKI